MIAAAALALTGCVGVPPGGLPEPAAPRAVGAERTLGDQAAADWPDGRWWRSFGDPQLDALIDEGLAASPDVAAALARLGKASALARQAGAAGLPSLDVQGGVNWRKESYNMGFPRAFQPQGWNDYGNLAAVAGFDPDLWGRNRAALAAATSQQRASAIDLDQARLALAGAIASAYADLHRLHEARELARQTLAMRVATETLIAQRAEAGVENRSGTRLAQAQSASARAMLAATEQELAIRRNQIAALVGAGPDRGLTITPPALSAPSGLGLPKDATTALVARRPDVAAARERVAAAASRIKAARADFFPAIRLEALVGVQSLGVGNLFSGGSDFGSAGPAISLPLFRGGELAGRYRGARADFDLAVADYDRTVIDAYRQVADAVTARRFVAERLADARAARSASESAYDLAQLRYRAGLSAYLDVLAVEDRAIDARRMASELEAAARDADIALIRALGGGFQPAPDPVTKD